MSYFRYTLPLLIGGIMGGACGVSVIILMITSGWIQQYDTLDQLVIAMTLGYGGAVLGMTMGAMIRKNY